MIRYIYKHILLVVVCLLAAPIAIIGALSSVVSGAFEVIANICVAGLRFLTGVLNEHKNRNGK